LANNVFANDLEIACKAADGESSVCFPDPCFSPPSPSAGWVLVPYANTAYARDLANGTTSVFISGLPVAKKDESFLKTSYGNEAAAGPKGLMTGVKKGKAYFKSWSMDVKVEGKNVCRHTDLITHNHGSDPSNTRTNLYKDTKLPSECKKDFEKRDKKCGISEKENKEFIGDAKQRNKRRAKVKKNNKPKDPFTVRDKTWKDKHCASVMLAFERKDHIEEKLNHLKDELNDWEEDLTSALADKTLGAAGDFVEGKVEATLGCGAIGGVIGGAIGFFFAGVGAVPGAAAGAEAGAAICNAVSLAGNVADAIETGSELWTNRDKIKEIVGKFDEYKEKLNDISDVISEEDPKKRAEQMKKLRDEAIEKAKQDPCLKARRCTLTPYANKDKREVQPKTIEKGQEPISDRVFNLNDASGCCPGQTGHHLIPETSISQGKDCAGKYSHNAAPVVCSEGGKDSGTHGELHDRTDGYVKDMMNGDYSNPGYDKCASAYTMDCAVEAGAQAHADQFPDSNCNKDCIKALLKEYYDPLNCKPKPVDKSGNAIVPTPVETEVVGGAD
jgi:hypothetical protein